MKVDLFRNSVRMARNRWRSRPGSALLAALGAAAAVAGAFFAGRAELYAAPPDALDLIARTAAFWFNVAHTLVFAYTTFELVYRGHEGRVLASLPVPPGAWFRYIALRSAMLHVPLLLPGLAFFAPLAALGRPDLFAYAAIYFVLTFALGLPLALALHLAAGRSLLAGDSPLKRAATGGLAAPESAFLFYSPALAFAGAAAAALVIELGLRLWLEAGTAAPAIWLSALTVAGGALALRSAARTFSSTFLTVLPRFWETEVVAQFRDDHLPRQPLGIQLARHLPPGAARVFRKDLVQMRRRHRVDAFAYILFGVVLALATLRTGAGTLGMRNLVWLLIACGTLFNPAFRLMGPDLEREVPLRTLPQRRRAVHLGKLAVVAIQQAPAVLIAAAVTAARDPLAAAVVLGAGGPLALLIGYMSLRVAWRSFPTVGPAGWTVRTAVAGALAAALAVL